MKDIKSELSSEVRLNTFAQSIFNESRDMGFKSHDYVKLMNELIDMTINNKDKVKKPFINNVESPLYKIDLPIMSKNLIIRKYSSEQDEKFVSKWFKDDDNKLFLLSTTSNPHLDIKSIVNNETNIFAMITLQNNKPIGLLALLNIDRESNKGEMRKMIGDMSERGKGYAKEASEIWLRYCTEYIGLSKIYITTIETNVKNISLNRQIGFKIEGLLKNECVIDNISHDVLRMAYFKR